MDFDNKVRVSDLKISTPEFIQGRGREGISDGTMAYYRVFLILDNEKVLEIGLDWFRDPPALHPSLAGLVEELVDPLRPIHGPVGRSVTEILADGGQPFVELDNDFVLWVCDDLYGTEIWYQPKAECDYKDFRRCSISGDPSAGG